MKRFLVGAGLLVLGCSATITSGGGTDGGSGNRDGFPPNGDLAGADLSPMITACGDTDPGCQTSSIGPPVMQFPLMSDPMPNPNEGDTGVNRDGNGYLGLSTSHTNFNFVWAAGDMEYGIGTVSKIDSKMVRETARYFTVTCFSNAAGSRAQCDGTNGCCARDDYDDYNFRLANGGQSSNRHQAIQQSNNRPSRTAVDFNGDMWVSNRAFGGQSSVSKIANDPSECIDRNGYPGIQTSSDVDGNGVVDTDCNQNGVPDDVADVMAAPCTNGKPQEFYGFDDECVLFTTNTNAPDQWGRPLALGPGSVDFGPADAWAGGFNNGKFFRIDGTTGMTKGDAQVGASPYGAAVDKNGILWAVELGNNVLYWFDTANPATTGTTRAGPEAGGYGMTLDRDENIWTGGYPTGDAFRYSPDRTAGTTNLSNGSWTIVSNPGGNGGANGPGRGIAADSRNAQSYWIWMARHDNWIVQIPGSAIPVPAFGTDVSVDGTAYPAIAVAGSIPVGAGVDTDQNIWAIAQVGSVSTRILVDSNGTVTPPNIATGTPHTGCPTGDTCYMQYQHPDGPGTLTSDPQPYTYSDFTGFGLRNFTNPKGFYNWVQAGCGTQETHWIKVTWDAEVPPMTTLTLRARAGNTPAPDATWSAWTMDFPSVTGANSADLVGKVPDPIPYLQVEFDFASQDFSTTPLLHDFTIVYKCGQKIG